MWVPQLATNWRMAKCDDPTRRLRGTLSSAQLFRLKPFWRKCSRQPLLTRGLLIVLLCALSAVVTEFMRTGRHAEGMVEVGGWVQIVRGPRPKSEKWPSAKKKNQEVRAEATEEVHNLEGQ